MHESPCAADPISYREGPVTALNKSTFLWSYGTFLPVPLVARYAFVHAS